MTSSDESAEPSVPVDPVDRAIADIQDADPVTLRSRMQELLEYRGTLDPAKQPDQIQNTSRALLALSARHIELQGTSGMPTTDQK